MITNQRKSIEVFISYAHQDIRLVRELEKHLTILQRYGLITVWHDRKIIAGQDWAQQTKAALERADIILLMISPDYLASDYIYDVEMRQALERENSGQAVIILVLLRTIDWAHTPIAKFQVLPMNGKPVVTWSNRDAAFADIARNLRVKATELLSPSQSREQWLEEGDALYNTGMYEEALSAYEQATHLEPDSALTYYKKGNTLYKLERYREALDAYQHATRLDPTYTLAYYGQGNALNRLNLYEEALDAYQTTIRLEPTYAPAYYEQGNMLYNLSRYEEAITAYLAVIRLDATYALAYYKQGNVLYNLSRYREAFAVYEQAIQLDPDIERNNENIGENFHHLRTRIELVQRFLSNAGFICGATSHTMNFVATTGQSVWRERFPKGLYVQILFDDSLDEDSVKAIYHDAKVHCDHAFIVSSQRPEISGWIASNMLHAEYGFIFLPITESLIKESVALNSELRTLYNYFDDRLGQNFDPYDKRDPVSDVFSFFGRESLTDELIRALRRGYRLGLFGLQKMGKSSILQKLQNKTEFPVAYVYLKSGESLANICKNILQSWSTDLRIKYPELKWPSKQFRVIADPIMALDSATKDLLTLLRDVTETPMLGIFLDEIEKIIPSREKDKRGLRLYISLMDTLRGLQQETNSLALLVAGIHPSLTRRNYLWKDQRNPMYQVISEKFLPPLDKGDCENMIRSLGQQIDMTYDMEALNSIIELSGAHAYLARQLCSLAYKQRYDTGVISKQNIQYIAQIAIRDSTIAIYFEDLWDELGNSTIWGRNVGCANHSILKTLAASSTGLRETDLHSSSNANVIQHALNALKERFIISSVEDDNAYYIRFSLFRDWIRLHILATEL